MGIPLLSIVIPTYQRNDLLTHCLHCLHPDKQSFPWEQYEVIVSDDSPNKSAQTLIEKSFSWVKWVPGACKGPAANRNNGSSYAQGKWLVFFDDDCQPTPHCLQAYAHAICQFPDCLVFEGKTMANGSPNSLSEVCPINETGGLLWSCNFAIAKDLFKNLDGFDERFPYAAMEDVEFRWRLQQQQQKFLFVPKALVYHPWKPAPNWKALQQHNTSTLIYLSIHPQERKKINCKYYLYANLRGFIKVTLPGVWHFKGRGIWRAFLKHMAFLQMAFVLFFAKIKGNSHL